jgi:hypothetical protein
MWWKRKKKRVELTPADIISRIREFLMDSQAPSAYHMSVLMGCSPMSDEVADHEEEASEERVQKIDHLIPILHAFAQTMSEATVKHQKAHTSDGSGDEELEELLGHLPPEIWEAAESVLTQISMTTVIGVISQLVDMGFLLIGNDPKIRKRLTHE